MLIILVYGLNQGFGEEFGFLSAKYYLKDVLLLDVAEAQTINNFLSIPWTIKPLYGMLSDTFPVFGYSRGPYIIFAGILGTLAWGLLAAVDMPVWMVGFCLTSASMSIASPDVMIDAIVAEKSRLSPKFTSDLQSLCWGSFAAGGLVACTMVGWIEHTWSPQVVFALTSPTAALIVMPAFWNWLGEHRLPKSQWSPKWGQLKAQRSLFWLAFFISVCAALLSVGISQSKSPWASGIGGVAVAALSSIATYMVLSKYNYWMGRVALYMFLSTAIQISADEAFFFWYTDNKEGPLFSPEFMGYIDFMGYISMLVGVALYNKLFSNWKYPKIFTLAQILLALVNMLDLVIVLRWNLKIGIPDSLFVLGEEALSPLFRRLLTMPVLVLAAKICPPGIEGTLFALLMSLSNFGGVVSKILGIGVVRALGVSKENYSGMPLLVVIKSLTRLLPILLIRLLVPDLTPADPIVGIPHGRDSDWCLDQSQNAPDFSAESFDSTGDTPLLPGELAFMDGTEAPNGTIELIQIRSRTISAGFDATLLGN